MTWAQIDQAKRMWAAGRNTAQIAIALHVPESVIYNSQCYRP